MDPEYEAFSLNEKAYTLITQGKYNQALELLIKATEYNPDNKDAWYNIGSCLYELGKPKDALKAYVHLLRLDPVGEEKAKRLAITAEAESGYRKTDLNEYLSAFECNEFGASNIKAYLNSEEPGREVMLEGAVEFLDKAIELNPNFAEAFNNRAFAHQKLGHYDDALRDYRRAIEIKPDYAIAWYNEGKCLIDLMLYGNGSVDPYDALRCFKRAHELDPDDPDASRMIAMLEDTGIDISHPQ